MTFREALFSRPLTLYKEWLSNFPNYFDKVTVNMVFQMTSKYITIVLVIQADFFLRLRTF